MAKVKVVKACAFTKWRRIYAQALSSSRPLPYGEIEAHIVICPHNWIITARPPTTPKPKARGKKGSK